MKQLFLKLGCGIYLMIALKSCSKNHSKYPVLSIDQTKGIIKLLLPGIFFD